ncbi:MAG: DedA family protein [Cellvibrionaceae bacterium]
MLIILFCSSFLAATILPFYSEVVLVSLLAESSASQTGSSVKSFPWSLWIVATLGNTLGAVFNWILGRYFLHFQDRRWFPFTSEKLDRSQRWFQKYGVWCLLFSWLPIVGDVFTFAAGVMRVNITTLFVLSGVGKGLRYAILIFFAEYFIEKIL